MKQRDGEKRQSSTAKIKSEAPPKKSDHAKEDRVHPCPDADTGTASRDHTSRKRGVVVAPTPDAHDTPGPAAHDSPRKS